MISDLDLFTVTGTDVPLIVQLSNLDSSRVNGLLKVIYHKLVSVFQVSIFLISVIVTDGLWGVPTCLGHLVIFEIVRLSILAFNRI